MNKKLTKVITLILSCLLLIGAAVGITVSANGEGDTPSVEIVNKNVAYEGAVQLVFALKENNLENSGLTTKVVFGAEVALDADVDELANGYVKNVAGHLTRGEGETEVVYALVYSNGIVAKELRKAVVATPVLVDAEGVVKYVGASVEYSPFVYAMNRFDNAQNSAAQIELYKALLDYGAAVQDLLSDSYADKEATVASWGGWADMYYNVTYTDAVKEIEYDYSTMRAATIAEEELPLAFEADRLAEGKIFKGFFNGAEQVYQTGVTSSAWNKYDIKPGSKAMNVVATYEDGTNPYVQFATETALPDWAYLNNPGSGAPADPVTKGYYSWFEDGVFKVGKYSQSVQHLYLNPAAIAGASVEENRAASNSTAAKYVSYEFDVRLDSAENLRPAKDNVVFYTQVYSLTEPTKQGNAKDRPSAFTHYYSNESWDIEGNWIAVGEWANIRFEFTQHPTLPGYLCSLYVNGKLVNDYSMEGSMLRATTGYSLPIIALESRWSNTDYASDIFYSVDNLRVEFEGCTEHEWVDVEHALYKKSDATCTAGTTYYKSCAKCSFQGTETFELDDKIPHTPAQIPNRNAIKTDATAMTQAEYYQSCSVCGNLDTSAETFFYGGFDAFANETLPNYVSVVATSNNILSDENGNYYLNIVGGTATSGKGEGKAILFDGDFDVSCVEQVVYEFDFKFNDATCYRGDNSTNSGWMYFFDKNGARSEINSRWDMNVDKLDDPTYVRFGGKKFYVGDWHHVKVVLDKLYDEENNFVGWTPSMYVDTIKLGSDFNEGATKLATYNTCVPTFGLYSRGSYAWDYDFDNVNMYATHATGTVSSDYEAAGAAKVEATCSESGIYYKTCSICGILSEEFIQEPVGHSFTNVVTDAALISEATASAPAYYYKSCAGCGDINTELAPFAHGEKKWLDNGEYWPTFSIAGVTKAEPAVTEGVKANGAYAYITSDEADGEKYLRLEKINSNASPVITMRHDGNIAGATKYVYEFDFRFGGASDAEGGQKRLFSAKVVTNGDAGATGAKGTHGTNWYQNPYDYSGDNFSFGSASMAKGNWYSVRYEITVTSDTTYSVYASSTINGKATKIGSWNLTELADDVPYLGFVSYGSYGPDTYTFDIKNYRFYADNGAHSVESTEVVDNSALAAHATADTPATYYRTFACCNSLDYANTFTYGYVDYLANGEKYPVITGPSFTDAPSVDEDTNETVAGRYSHIYNDNGNYVWRYEAINTGANGMFILSTTDKQPVANATKYVFGFDFRYNGGAADANSRAFLLRGPSATGVADKGGAGNNNSFKQWTVNVGDGCLTNFFGKTVNVGDWINVQIEYVPNYTEGVLVSYTCDVSVNGVSAYSGTLTCDTTGEAAYTNAPMFDIYMSSSKCVSNLSFDIDNFVYVCEVAESN